MQNLSNNAVSAVTVETITNDSHTALFRVAGGKAMRALESESFKIRLGNCINTVAALSVAFGTSDVVNVNGVQYRVGEYDLPYGLADLVEFSKIYFSDSARYDAEPYLTSTLIPDADKGLMSPDELNAFVSFLNGLDGVNIKIRKLDSRGVKTWNDLGVIFINGAHYVVNSQPLASDSYRACYLDYRGNNIPVNCFQSDNTRLGEFEVQKWLIGLGVGGSKDVPDNEG